MMLSCLTLAESGREAELKTARKGRTVGGTEGHRDVQ